MTGADNGPTALAPQQKPLTHARRLVAPSTPLVACSARAENFGSRASTYDHCTPITSAYVNDANVTVTTTCHYHGKTESPCPR
jgi:hypothetical protein